MTLDLFSSGMYYNKADTDFKRNEVQILGMKKDLMDYKLLLGMLKLARSR